MYFGEQNQLKERQSWITRFFILCIITKPPTFLLANLQTSAKTSLATKEHLQPSVRISLKVKDDNSVVKLTPNHYVPLLTLPISKAIVQKSKSTAEKSLSVSDFTKNVVQSSDIPSYKTESIVPSTQVFLSSKSTVGKLDHSTVSSNNYQISRSYSQHYQNITHTILSSFRDAKSKTIRVTAASLVYPSVIFISTVCINTSVITQKTSTAYTTIYHSMSKNISKLMSLHSHSSPVPSTSLRFSESSRTTSEYHFSTKQADESSNILTSTTTSIEPSFRFSSSSSASKSTLKLHTSSLHHSFSKTSSITFISPTQITSSLPLKTQAIPLNPSIKKCDVVISDFSNAMTNFTQCILLNYHPMKACYSCFHQHDKLLRKHRNISHACYDKLVTDYNMQYQIVPQMYQSQLNTWKLLGCEKCYDRSSPNVLSEDFLYFVELLNKTKSCFMNATSSARINESHQEKNASHNGVCHVCNKYYQELQKKFPYYQDDAGEEAGTNWCADINTAVNETRHMWSSVYHCGKVEKDLEAIIALTCFFCFLPIIFYVGAKLHSDVKERKNADRYNNYYDSD